MGKTSDKTVYKTTGWCGFGSGSNTAAVDVEDGRIARIRPLHLDEKLDPKSNVYYLNLPKRWVAGQVVDPMADKVIIGATVTMQEEGNSEAEALKTTTDEFGDFWFRQVEGKKYHLWFEAEGQGFVTRELADVDATEADANIGRVSMYKMIPLG